MNLDLKRILRWRSLMAVALIFWCAGAGCMIVSYARAAAIDSVSTSDGMDHAMGDTSSMGGHACCKARHRFANRARTQLTSTAKSSYAEQSLLTIPSVPTRSGAMNCCPLTSGSMVVASRMQSNDRATVSNEASSSSLLLINSNPAPLAFPQRLPDRAHSYLLDCAFLI